MESPLISVIIPYYKGERFIAETLESIFKQNYPHLEIIIVNDGSPTESLAALEPFTERVTIISQENKGQSAARNTGLKHASGSIIAFLDQDDLWTDTHLDALLPAITKEGYDVARGNIKKIFMHPDGTMTTDEPMEYKVLLGAALFNKKVFDTIGDFDETMLEGEDFDVWIRIKDAQFKEIMLPETVLLYRRHDTNRSKDPDFVKNGIFLSLRNRLNRNKNHGK